MEKVAVISLNGEQRKNLAQMIDMTLKQRGMTIYAKIRLLMNVLDNPKSTDEGNNISTYEIPESCAGTLENVFDTAIRQVGLNGFYGISELVLVFQEGFSNAQQSLPKENTE